MVIAQAEKELPFTVKRLRHRGHQTLAWCSGCVRRLVPEANIFVCGEPLCRGAGAEGLLLPEGEVLAGRVRGLVVRPIETVRSALPLAGRPATAGASRTGGG